MGSKQSKAQEPGAEQNMSQEPGAEQNMSQEPGPKQNMFQASGSQWSMAQTPGAQQRNSYAFNTELRKRQFYGSWDYVYYFNGIWYRHSGEPEVDGIPNYELCNFRDGKDLSQIPQELVPHHITHMWVEGQHVPSLQNIAPRVTHLKIWHISDNSQLRSLTSLKYLKSLYLNGEFSMGLPRIIEKLSTLEELYLDCCSLSDLPVWKVQLKHLKTLSLSENNYSGGLSPFTEFHSSLKKLDLRKCNLSSLSSSLSTLRRLQYLNLSHNNFATLPDVIGSLSSLKELHLESCKLSKLPKSFRKLTSLKYLFLDGNDFTHLPPVISSLKNLLKLSISQNKQLETLDSGIESLTNLQELVLSHCSSLTTPPANVIKQGLPAIKQYYKDLAKGKGRSLPAATVCVIGASKSGKTSLIQTLQQNRRILTGSQSQGGDVSTKVFKFEEVEVDGTKLRFIDFGGQEVYHLAYRLTLQANCVPIIVVNMKLYQDTAKEIGDHDAVRRLYFDWMAHLYLAQPDLPAPKLVLTHKDKFSDKDFRELVKRFLASSDDVRDAILLDEHRLNHKQFRQITHLAERACLFESEQIFEIGTKYDHRVFDTLKIQVLKRCMQHVMHVPKIWEDIEDTIQSLSSGFSLFEDLLPRLHTQHGVDREQLVVVLTYMHYSGKLLWYKDFPPLQQYVFHKITAVTGLLNVLYDHNELSRWRGRHEKFREREVQSSYLPREKFEQSVKRFLETGIISWVLLAYLIQDESEFTSDDDLAAALAILTYFRLVFGPVSHDGETSYFVPHFATGYLSSSPNSNFDVQLHVDIALKGLPLPLYVYHEMTVGLLELYSNPLDTPTVLHNGATVEVEDCMLSLTHDAKAGRATILVSCDIKDIDKSWSQLIVIVNNTIQHILDTWEAARLVCVFYCAHCELKGDSHPCKDVNPSWCILSKTKQEVTNTKMRIVRCQREKIFSPFKFPCQPLPESNKEDLKEYVTNVRRLRRQILNWRSPPADNLKVKSKTASATHAMHTFMDVADMLQDEDLKPTTTKDADVIALYHNTDKVYKMTSPRGMAIIINNYDFTSAVNGLSSREGSETDVRNMERMLEDFDFEVKTMVDLSGQEMLTAINSTVTQRENDMEDFGMFILVLMSHGGENDRVYGTDGSFIQLKDVFHLLSASNFPAMSGKPKFVIVQACGGVLGDYGEHGRKLMATVVPGVVAHSDVCGKISHLNTDDLILIKSSFNSYASLRNDNHGSLFISCLVYTFYKHGCHSDVESLCKVIQQEVRAQSLQLAENHPKHCYGQAPVYFSMLTNYRDLYLFPGYDGTQTVDDPTTEA